MINKQQQVVRITAVDFAVVVVVSIAVTTNTAAAADAAAAAVAAAAGIITVNTSIFSNTNTRLYLAFCSI